MHGRVVRGRRDLVKFGEVPEDFTESLHDDRNGIPPARRVPVGLCSEEAERLPCHAATARAATAAVAAGRCPGPAHRRR